MWRILRLTIPYSKDSVKVLCHRRHYSPLASNGKSSRKVIFGIISSVGLGSAGAVVYGKYDPEFWTFLEANIPYINSIYKMFSDYTPKSSILSEDGSSEKKLKDGTPRLLKKMLDREKPSVIEVSKSLNEQPRSKPAGTTQFKNDKHLVDSNILKTESKASEQALESFQIKEDFVSHENAINKTISKLTKTFDDAVSLHKLAAGAVKFYTAKIYEALDSPEGQDGDILWKEVNTANLGKQKSLKLAKQKGTETRILIENLKKDVKRLSELDSQNPLVKNGERLVSNYLIELQKAELDVSAAEKEAKTAAEYEQLVKTSKDQFRKELQGVLPNYFHSGRYQIMTEGELNLLIAHAKRRIEQLQKQIEKQHVTEKIRVDEAVRNQRMQDDIFAEIKAKAEIQRYNLDSDSVVENCVATLKANFEANLHQHLFRQAVAHANHLREALKVQKQELERKNVLELEEKLLHQKEVLVSEISENMSRLKGIVNYLKARREFDKSYKYAQALWLACQAMAYKITLNPPGNLSPLAEDIAALKLVADKDSDFVNLVVSSIPPEAVNRGVFTKEILKQRFEKVKDVCRKVALIDENNDSIYRYFLSYLQSFLIIETVSVPKKELDSEVAVSISEWDTFDILSRISYCLKVDDFEQALCYANLLKKEPRAVAKDWMNEVKLLLATQLAVKALLAHAIAVGVQAYH